MNIDQILGHEPEHGRAAGEGLSGNVVFVQTDIGKKQGQLVVAGLRRS